MIMKTRFAPSPTGEMHFGNIRAALFNYLVSKKNNSDFLLRIEDTDKSRSNPAFTEQIYTDLEWLGLNWTDGPYKQSERAEIYNSYYDKLITNNQAYPCFCSDEKLKLNRKLQLSQGLPPRYAGTCKELSQEEVASRIAAGETPSLRFAVPQDVVIMFDDAIKGEQKFSSNDIGDFIIRRADGSSSFMFCSILDDSSMGVDLVLRGEDHLTNTPRQLLILQAFGLKEPRYGHMSLIVNHDGGKFSKRLGSLSAADLKEQGFLPLAVVNYLARVGHSFKQEIGFANLHQLAQNLSLESFSTSPSRFDEAQLEYWQKQAVINLSDDEFWQWIKSDVSDLIADDIKYKFISAVRANVEFPQFARHYAELIKAEKLTYSDEGKDVLREAPDNFFKTAREFMNDNFDYQELVNHLKSSLNIKGKALFMPLRIAITGQNYGPEMLLLTELIGKEKILQRLEQAENL